MSNALVAHNGLYVRKVEVNDCGDVDQIGNPLYCLLKDFVGLHQGFRHAGTLVHNFQNLVIRDNDQSIHAVTQLLNTGHRIVHTGLCFKAERLGYNTDGQDSFVLGELCDNRSRTGSGSAAHTAGNKYHICSV